MPDADDPPDLEFYSGNGFWYHDRAYMMVLNYAASPLALRKHGPHLDNEWWTSRDGLRWERPARGVNALEVFPQIPRLETHPLIVNGTILFPRGRLLLGLPEDRISYVSARANGEFSTKPFPMPAADLLLNAALPAPERPFAKDQAYVMVAVLDEQGMYHPRIRGGEMRHPQRRPERHPAAMGRRLRTPARRTDHPAPVLPSQRQHLCRHGPDRPVKSNILLPPLPPQVSRSPLTLLLLAAFQRDELAEPAGPGRAAIGLDSGRAAQIRVKRLDRGLVCQAHRRTVGEKGSRTSAVACELVLRTVQKAFFLQLWLRACRTSRTRGASTFFTATAPWPATFSLAASAAFWPGLDSGATPIRS